MQTRDNYINSPELQTQEKLLKSIFSKEGQCVIFDIGACEGESSVRYARLFPNASIYTFEPLPSNFTLVEENIKKYKITNIHPIQLCLSDTVGETTFYVSSGKPENAIEEDWNYGNKSSSILPPSEKTTDVHSWLKFENEIKVSTSTLKQFCQENNINKIDFVHMDVQGAELMVLKGAQDFIQNINSIWLEVEAVELYQGQPLKNDIEHFMCSQGFVKIADTVYTTAGDQFWINQKFMIENDLRNKIFAQRFFSKIKFIYKKIRRKILN
ncbi:MAG: FkbM family methyltransferase [Chitinophagales bacterium]